MREVQRLRITFSRGEELKYISHLDLTRLWDRALRRAGIPIAYSQGFNPHPHLSLAAPLPVGVTSEGELMEVFLTRRIAPVHFIRGMSSQLPKGLEVLKAQEIGLRVPSLQSQVLFSEYCVQMETDQEPAEIQRSLRSLLALKDLPWQHLRDKEIRHYDLRALIDDLWLLERSGSGCVLGMRLRTDSGGTGRTEQVTAALGFPHPPSSVHRTKLLLMRK